MPTHGDPGAGLSGVAGPTPKLPHLDDPRFAAYPVGDTVEGTPDIFVFNDVLEELCYRAHAEPEATSASVLTGAWFVGPNGNYVEVDGFSNTTYVTKPSQLLHRLRANVKALQVQAPDLAVGLCVTRPGSEGRIGPDDLILLNSYFNLTYHVLVVIDGPSDRLGFYARDESQGLRNVGAYVLTPAGDDGPVASFDCPDAIGGDSATSVPDTTEASVEPLADDDQGV